MKTIILLAATACVLTSCVKDFNCQCTYTNVDDTNDTYQSDSSLRNNKKEAEANCEYLEGTSYSGQATYEKTCELLPA